MSTCSKNNVAQMLRENELPTMTQLSLRCIIGAENPKIILLQETMGNGVTLVGDFNSFMVRWNFLVVYSNGLSGGLATGWTQNLILRNSYALLPSLYANFFH
jgi:hypothetical protein